MNTINIVLPFVIAGISGWLSYWWYKVLAVRRKLKWIPQVPGLPLLGNAWNFRSSTEFLATLTRLSNQYNGLCTLEIATKKFILATDYEFLEFLLTSMNILNKSREYKFTHRWLGSGLITAEGSKWKKSRKILTPAFHFSILEQFVEVFESKGRIMVELLEKEVDNGFVDVYPYVTMCTLDIISETAMGVSVNAQRDLQSDYVFAVKEICRIIPERSFSPIKTFDVIYPLTKDYYKEVKHVKTLHAYTNNVIRKRRSEFTTTNIDTESSEIGVRKKMAFLDLLLQTTVDGKPLSDQDIREEVDTFMFAGHDTTASAISFTFYCLACHPEIQARVMKEQKLIFGADRHRTVTYRDLQEMKYLELVIKEALRLFPSVPLIGRVTDTEVEYKDGKMIPKDVSILIFIFGINRNPKFHTEPERFDPSRFTNCDGKSPYAYIPFSAGPRNCIGQKFAMLEMKSIVSMLIRNLVLYPPPFDHRPVLTAETVLKSSNGIKLKLGKRHWI